MTAPMRVLLLAHRFPPHGRGGVETWTAHLAAALRRLGHTVAIGARDDRPGDGPEPFTVTQDPGGVFWVRHRHSDGRSPRDAWRDPRMEGATAFLLDATNPDVVHLAHPDGWGVWPVSLARARGRAAVLTLHDYKWICARGQMVRPDHGPCSSVRAQACVPCVGVQLGAVPLRGRLRRLEPLTALARRLDGRLPLPGATAPWRARQAALARSARLAHGVSAPSAFVARRHERELAIAVEVLRHGLDPFEIAPLPPAPLRIGFFGAGAPTKGLDLLRRAVAGLPAGSVELQVHGPPPDDRAGLVCAGPYDPQEVADRMAGCSVVALPSQWDENAPMVALEARAAGRPLLVSDRGGLPELVRDGVDGRILSWDDAEAWSLELALLAATPTRLARWAAQGAPPRSTRQWAQDHVAFYRRALLRSASPHSGF